MCCKRVNFELLELLDIVGFIVGGIVYRPKWPFYSCCDYIGLFGTGFIQGCIWVELPVQRRLCPIF